MKHTLFLLGPSDLEAQNAVSKQSVAQGKTRVEFTMAGMLPILPFIREDKTLSANSQSAIIGVHRIRRPASTHFNVFNMVGDADSSPVMLKHVQTIVDQLRPSRCFNRPANVLRTGRAQLPATLSGISGCIVPAVLAGAPRDYTELVALCQAFDHWPLILRSSGEHGGEQMVLLDNLRQLDELRPLPWLYSGICLIEYHDYNGDDGLYQKNRVIVVDGVPYPRHAIFSRHWMIHAGGRGGLMAEDRELARREEKFIANEVQEYYPVFTEMYQRIGLDIFGVDFAVVNGKVLVFEANACMKFLDRKNPAGSRFGYLNDYVKALKRAVKKMLVQA